MKILPQNISKIKITPIKNLSKIYVPEFGFGQIKNATKAYSQDICDSANESLKSITYRGAYYKETSILSNNINKYYDTINGILLANQSDYDLDWSWCVSDKYQKNNDYEYPNRKFDITIGEQKLIEEISDRTATHMLLNYMITHFVYYNRSFVIMKKSSRRFSKIIKKEEEYIKNDSNISFKILQGKRLNNVEKFFLGAKLSLSEINDMKHLLKVLKAAGRVD